MFDIHEKPIPNDEYIDIPPYFGQDMDASDEEEEAPEEYADGYPDELIPAHAFTNEEEEYVEYELIF